MVLAALVVSVAVHFNLVCLVLVVTVVLVARASVSAAAEILRVYGGKMIKDYGGVEEIRMIRLLVKQIVEVLPPTKSLSGLK